MHPCLLLLACFVSAPDDKPTPDPVPTPPALVYLQSDADGVIYTFDQMREETVDITQMVRVRRINDRVEFAPKVVAVKKVTRFYPRKIGLKEAQFRTLSGEKLGYSAAADQLRDGAVAIRETENLKLDPRYRAAFIREPLVVDLPPFFEPPPTAGAQPVEKPKPKPSALNPLISYPPALQLITTDKSGMLSVPISEMQCIPKQFTDTDSESGKPVTFTRNCIVCATKLIKVDPIAADWKYATADGQPLSARDVSSRLTAGEVCLSAPADKPIDPVFLKAFQPATLTVATTPIAYWSGTLAPRPVPPLSPSGPSTPASPVPTPTPPVAPVPVPAPASPATLPANAPKPSFVRVDYLVGDENDGLAQLVRLPDGVHPARVTAPGVTFSTVDGTVVPYADAAVKLKSGGLVLMRMQAKEKLDPAYWKVVKPDTLLADYTAPLATTNRTIPEDKVPANRPSGYPPMLSYVFVKDGKLVQPVEKVATKIVKEITPDGKTVDRQVTMSYLEFSPLLESFSNSVVNTTTTITTAKGDPVPYADAVAKLKDGGIVAMIYASPADKFDRKHLAILQDDTLFIQVSTEFKASTTPPVPVPPMPAPAPKAPAPVPTPNP